MLYKTETTLPLLWRPRFATYIRLRQNALGGPPVDQEQLHLNEPFVSLTLVFCQNCSLVQITETVFPRGAFFGTTIRISLPYPECVNNFETPVAGSLVSNAALPRVHA
ncbi:MAG: hypothetical protein ACREAQ_06370, partial [Nitrososphaera sp.]